MDYITTHMRVVAALVIREMATRFGNKPGGYIWALLDPVAHVAFMTLIFAAFARSPSLGSSFPLFFASGYMAFQFYQAMAGYLNGAVGGNRALLNYPNVAPIDTVVARYILQFHTTAAVAMCIIGGIALIEGFSLSLRWPYLIEAAFAATLLAVGVALFNNVMFKSFPLYEKFFDIATRPMFLISGVFYLPEGIPHPFRDILLLNPLTHLIMLFRKGIYPEYRADYMDMNYLYAVAFSLLFIGMTVFTLSRDVLRGR